MNKICTKCKKELPATSNYFHTTKAVKCGLTSDCKICRNAYAKIFRTRHKEKISARMKEKRKSPEWKAVVDRRREYRKTYRKLHPEVFTRKARKWFLKKAYGLTPDQYQKACEAQNNLCCICGSSPEKDTYKKLSVDHDHNTKVLRGLICHFCNVVLGCSRDNPEILLKAAEYLRNPPGVKI